MPEKNNPLIILFITAILFSGFTFAQLPNSLTAKETSEGWKLLFNGKDLVGWHSYLQKGPGKAWQSQNGAIMLNKSDKNVNKDCEDLPSDDEFENFDFKVE